MRLNVVPYINRLGIRESKQIFRGDNDEVDEIGREFGDSWLGLDSVCASGTRLAKSIAAHNHNREYSGTRIPYG